MAEQRWNLCPCGNRLGEQLRGGLEAQRHKGRRTFGLMVTQCEACHRWNAPPTVLAALAAAGFAVDPDDMPAAA